MNGPGLRRLLAKLRRAVRRRSTSRQRDTRARFFDDADRHTPFLAVEARGAMFLVSTSDVNIGRTLFANQTRKEFGRLAKAVRAVEVTSGKRPGGMFVDVGANIGTTVVPAVLEHGFERAVALEPVPSNLFLLSQNVRLNDLGSRIVVLGVAASDSVGVSHLRVDHARSGLATLVTDPDEATLTVETTTLDMLVAAGDIPARDVAFLWIDVEGHEMRVLSGATVLLGRGIPVVIEVNFEDDDRRHLRELERILGPDYTHCLDLIPDWKEQPSLQPMSRLGELAAPAKQYTDLLFVRLSDDG